MNKEILLLKYNKHSTSHLLHLILSIITVGIWVPFWILVALSNTLERNRITKELNKLQN